ncbi:cytochrome P450 4C1 isoform X3 [Halyomorpha halys]|uniref:cytochrome P450 4C1 isoform X3 n=1 Tax=Halyomorpha halys TaxID=286706 RepID=UPI0034D1E3BB
MSCRNSPSSISEMALFYKAQKVISSAISALYDLILSLYSWTRFYWMISRLPGLPLAQSYKQWQGFQSKLNAVNTLVEWRDQYKTCHKVYLSFLPLIFAYSPQLIQELLSKKQKHNDKGKVYHTLLPLLGNGLITSKGEKWFAHRRLLTPAFHSNILQSFFESFKSETPNYIKRLKGSKLMKEYGDICPHTRQLTLKFICETAMGFSKLADYKEAEAVIKSMHKLEEIATLRVMRPWLLSDGIFKMSGLYKELNQNKKTLHDFSNILINRRRTILKNRLQDPNFEVSKRKEIFLDQLILQQFQGVKITDDDIRDEVNTFIFAEKAYNELEEIFSDSKRQPTMDDLRKMEYLDRCIKEALRLYPSVPIIARRLTQDQPIVFTGIHILPKDADCFIIPYVTHRNPEQFPNPEVFDPDNFLPERVKKRHPYSYIPFSAGPRNCIGKRFANIAKKTVLSWILREFKIESKLKQEDLNLIPSTVLVPSGGLPVKLTLRKSHK